MDPFDFRRCLVVIFLRGGADGLSLLPPLDDDDYLRARPVLGILRKDALDLDGRFGLHKSLGALLPLYQEGVMAVVPAAGSEDESRSHFEAQDVMEHGGLAAGGWLGRYLHFRPRERLSPLTALALGATLPESLQSAPTAVVFNRIEQFSMAGDSPGWRNLLGQLYESTGGALASAARDTIQALRKIEEMKAAPYRPALGVEYPADEFALQLREAARLIKAEVGMETVSIDLHGWDTHFGQGVGWDDLLRKLAGGLAAFYRDLGPRMETTSVVVMSEFGRRLKENSSFGTDHGRGGAMFVIGGGVKGGKVAGTWRGLGEAELDGPGDVPVCNNYRDVLAPVLARHGGGEKISEIFPGQVSHPLDI